MTATSQASPRRSVLIVDDNQAILSALKVSLGIQYTVTTCDNPTLGVDLVKQLNPDLIICDIKMPEHDGFWVMQEVRKFNTTTPFIYYSAYQDSMGNDDAQGIFKPYAYISKGDAKLFRQVVADCLRGKPPPELGK